MNNLRAFAAIFGFGAFLVGAVLAVDGGPGAASLLTGGAIVIGSLVVASSLDRVRLPRAEREEAAYLPSERQEAAYLPAESPR